VQQGARNAPPSPNDPQSEDTRCREQQQPSERIPPPPPPLPPPPQYPQARDDKPQYDGYAPPPDSWYTPDPGASEYADESASWIPMDPRMYPPPPQYDQQQQQQQGQQYYDERHPSNSGNDMDGSQWTDVQNDSGNGNAYTNPYDAIEELTRQHEQLQQRERNLTDTLRELEQREGLRVRQIDLLTERMMESDAEHARERLLLAECQSNCTQLQRQVQELLQDVERQQRQHDDMKEQSGRDADNIAALKKELDASRLQAEELALMIERHRIRSLMESDDDEEDDDESVYRGRRSARKAKKKQQGFWAWLFGWGATDNDDASNRDADGRNLDDVYTTARSTLLSALQTERSSVHELETIVASLQQNNSAISEQVKSRDQVIDELNDRIAVFEEDKMVLKAALKQLQKDLSSEAPKTQKLVQDLEAAQLEVRRLKKEIKGLILTHQEEVAALRDTISVKEDSIAMTESNLTVIGTYVDRLEARLAEFSIARRDIEVREAKCEEIERSAEEAEKARSELHATVKEMEAEHDELRTLLRELANERAKLLSKNQDLESEVKTLKAHDARVQESLAKLNSDYGELVVQDMALQHKLDKYEKDAVESTVAAGTLKERLSLTETHVEELRQQVESEKNQRQTVQDLLRKAEETSKQMKERLEQLQAINEALAHNNTRIQQEVRTSRCTTLFLASPIPHPAWSV
jgi:chromosome segregation ATPase